MHSTIASIHEDFKAQNLFFKEVHRMYNMELCILDLSPKGKEIYNLKTVCHVSGLTVEATVEVWRPRIMRQ